MIRYFIVNSYGDVLGEADTRAEAEAKMHDVFSAEQIETDEIEVISDEAESFYIITNKRDIDRCWKNEKHTAEYYEDALRIAEEYDLMHIYELRFADDSGDLISITERNIF